MINRFAFGFTLIEILIVLFIISIVSSIAILSINHNENRQLETFANELTQMLSLAEEQAMLQPSVLGLIIDHQSLRFATYHENERKNNQWTLLKDHILNEQNIPKEVNVRLEAGEPEPLPALSDHESVKKPQIIISTNGDITPFTIYIGRIGKKPRYVVRGEADGHITNQLLS